MKLLLIRLDGLGDTVLATPLLRALREGVAEARVTVVASPLGASALTGHPGVDDLLTIDMARSTMGEKRALGRRLRAAGFDAGLTVTEKLWGYHWLRMSRATVRVGFWAGATQPLKGLLLGGALTHRIPSPNDPAQPSERHEVERLMRLAEPLGIRAAPGPLWLPPAADASAAIARPLALHLSNKWMADGWTRDHLEGLARALAAASPAGLTLSAGPAEAGWSADFARAVDAPLLPGASFASWCAGLRGCAALVTMDTGAVHVAAAVGLPVVDVFPLAGAGHTVPRWGPWMVAHRVVLRGGPQEARRIQEEICSASRSLLQDAVHAG